MPAIRVVLADDQQLFREGLRAILSVDSGIEVVAEAADGEAAVVLSIQHEADVVLMDLQMPGTDGVEATRRVRALRPETQVIALTTFADDRSVLEALRAGAVGYLLKDLSAQKLFEAIQEAARGRSVLAPIVASKVVAELARLSNGDKSVLDLLTDRERDVLKELAGGASNKDIANALDISEGTVKNHMSNIFEKLEVTDRVQAALKARELGAI
jgi:DNA-binding NarL/FixJ family response regulator